MKKASSSFLLVVISILFISFQSYAQNSVEDILAERVQQTISLHQRLKLGELLRLPPQEQRQLEVTAITILGQSYQGPAVLHLLSQGQVVQSVTLRRQLKSERVPLPPMIKLQSLELGANEEVYLESITVEVKRLSAPMPSPHQGGQVTPHSALTVQLREVVRGRQEVPLKQLIRQQLGLKLEGAQIERVALEIQSLAHTNGTAQLKLNGRLVGPLKRLASGQRRIPINLHSQEEVRSLSLVVTGEVQLVSVMIRVGNVRPVQGLRMRLPVGREILANVPLSLGNLLPYETRLVTAISLEANPRRAARAQVLVLAAFGEMLGQVMVTQVPMSPVLQLMRPMALRDIFLQSQTPVMINAVELQF